MKVCTEIKRLIDEADQPDALGFEVSNHLSVCMACKSFAHERVVLRRMLASGKRVSAPNNFEAMLTARLAKAKARKSFSWLSPPSFMRLGTATAAVAILIFAVQYGNLFSNSNQAGQPSPDISGEAKGALGAGSKPQPANSEFTNPADRDPNHLAGIEPVRHARSTNQTSRIAQRYYHRRGSQVVAASTAPEGYSAINEGGVVLVRGPNGEHEVPMPTVSVGAQPLLYVNAGRVSPAARNSATSF
jgi:hypothetical protein